MTYLLFLLFPFLHVVTSLANGSHRLSTLVAADLRETLHDTISDALKSESSI